MTEKEMAVSALTYKQWSMLQDLTGMALREKNHSDHLGKERK